MSAINYCIGGLRRNAALHFGFIGLTLVQAAIAWTGLTHIRGRLRNAEESIVSRQGLLARKSTLQSSLSNLQLQRAAVSGDLSALRDRLPSSPDESQFLHFLSSEATATGVSLGDFRPGGITKRPHCQEIELRLRGTGDFARVCRWLHSLENQTRLMRVANLSISGPATTGGDCVVDLQVHLLFGLVNPSPSVHGVKS